MDASVFVRQPNASTYDNLGSKKFSCLPRVDEFISVEVKGRNKYFQVIVIHHATGAEQAIEIYAVETEPTWQSKKSRAIGFGS